MRKNILLLSLAVMFLHYSCSKDKTEIPEKALLKSKSWYHSIYDTIPLTKSEYIYDNFKRLVKINHCIRNTDTIFRYESLYYNNDNKLDTRLNYTYVNDSVGWILTDSSYYIYENHRLIYENTNWPVPNSYQVSYQYIYEGSKIAAKYRYDNQQLGWCLGYEYSDNLCIKETRYIDFDLKVTGGYTLHFYEEDVLIRSEKYTAQNHNFQIITYTYDIAGNLIIEESKKTEFEVEAPVEYVYRYEYY